MLKRKCYLESALVLHRLLTHSCLHFTSGAGAPCVGIVFGEFSSYSMPMGLVVADIRAFVGGITVVSTGVVPPPCAPTSTTGSPNLEHSFVLLFRQLYSPYSQRSPTNNAPRRYSWHIQSTNRWPFKAPSSSFAQPTAVG